MTGSSLRPERPRNATDIDTSLFDPRQGDAEDDASSPRQRSPLAIAGSLLAEVILPKLVFAWIVSILLPAVLLGSAPLVATAWLAKVSRTVAALTELATMLILLAVFDSQSVKSAEKRGACIDPHGFDAGKLIKGKKRHIPVDMLGLLLHAIIHSAGIQDRDGAISLLATMKGQFPLLEKLFADQAYQGPFRTRGGSPMQRRDFIAGAQRRLRHDPLMKVAVGRCLESSAPSASQSTISRLENAPSRTEAARLTAALVDQAGTTVKPRRQEIFDIDDSFCAAQLEFWNAHYDERGFASMHTRLGTAGRRLRWRSDRCQSVQQLLALGRYFVSTVGRDSCN